MKYGILLLVLLSTACFGQNRKGFVQLSGPKKTWVLFHPFKAETAFLISQETNRVSDSIATSHLLDGDKSGGQVDAFRHAYWMARLHEEIGRKAAASLGEAHEKENYLMFKKGTPEDGLLPDKASSDMDLWNNQVGLSLVSMGTKIPKKGLIYQIVNAIHQGKMRIIKKDKNGNFLTCDGKTINPKSLLGKWENNKCLVASNEK